MTLPATIDIAQKSVAGMKEVIDAGLKDFGLDKAQDEKAYFKGSRELLKALIAALTQRMFDDGAPPHMVKETLLKGQHLGWEVFLDNHPEIKAKTEKEKAEYAAKIADIKLEDGDDDSDDEDCDDDN